VEKFSKFYQQKKKGIITLLIALFILLVILGYIFAWSWTGFIGKTLWDWLKLSGTLAIPVAAVWITSRLNHDREIAEENQKAASLQEYINKMSDLLLDKKLRKSKKSNEVSIIANALTSAVFLNLNGKQKRIVLQFIYTSGLIDVDKSIIDLDGVNLRKANLIRMPLRKADLHGINLRRAEMSGVRLRESNLTKANLSKTNLVNAHLIDTILNDADFTNANLSDAKMKGAILVDARMMKAKLCNAKLRGANFTGANLTGANLKDAVVTKKQLDSVKSLKGAIMPDGSKYS